MQNTRTTKGGIVTWDSADWRAGLGAEGAFSTSQGDKQVDAQGWKTLSKIDPFRIYGILTPGLAPNAYSNSNLLAAAIVSGQIYNGTILFGTSSDGKIYKASYFGNTPSITNAGTFPHTISGSTVVGQDTLLYAHNSSSIQIVSLFYSYYNSTSWNVGADVNLISGVGTFNDTFMSTVPTQATGPGTVQTGASTTLTGTSTLFLTTFRIGDTILVTGETVRTITAIASNTSLTVGVAFSTSSSGLSYTYFPNSQRQHPHPMAIGSDGILYIGSGNRLHAYDGSTGANGTFSPSVLTFAQGFEIIGIRKYNDSLLIAGNYSPTGLAAADGSGEALVYIWNYTDLNVTQVVPLEDPYVSAIFIYQGNPTVITSGIQERNGRNKVKVITGISTTRIFDFDGVIPLQRGIVVADDVLYLNAGGKILAYGDKYAKSSAVNHIGTCTNASSSGFLLYDFTDSALVASSDNNVSTGSLNNFGSVGTDSASMTSFSLQLPLPHGKRARIVSVQVQYYQTLATNAGNGTLAMSLITDFVTTTSLLSSVSSVDNPLIKKYLYTASGAPLPHCTTLGWSMTFTGPSTTGTPFISQVQIEYEDADIGSNTII